VAEPDILFLSPDRFFDPDPAQWRLARELYAGVAGLPIVSPHGHVDPRLLANEDATLGTPADLFIIPDHYVFRMLYSQGVPLEALGVPRPEGVPHADSPANRDDPVEADHRKIWQIFADHFCLFRGTPSGTWLNHELVELFGIRHKLTSANAQAIYDEIAAKLATPAFRPRALFERFKIELLATTDAASDPLTHHQALRASGWNGRVIPTFRPDTLVNLLTPSWTEQLDALSQASGVAIFSYGDFVRALEERRAFFKRMGATATDHSADTAYTGWLDASEAETVFQRALQGQVTADDARRFPGNMMMEMARMSTEDGLVMQFHVGIVRGHNTLVRERFGNDKGGDIPTTSEFTHNLHPLLDAFGNNPRLTLILFTLDETTYARELAPLAGHYPALRLGPPWWFHDSPNGMRRYLDQVVETAGLFNTAGFNDDTRAFCSIPARHDLWRRVSCDWLAGLIVRGQIDEADAAEMAPDLAVGLARRAYRL
jgi:glucuronate isomerase